MRKYERHKVDNHDDIQDQIEMHYGRYDEWRMIDEYYRNWCIEDDKLSRLNAIAEYSYIKTRKSPRLLRQKWRSSRIYQWTDVRGLVQIDMESIYDKTTKREHRINELLDGKASNKNYLGNYVKFSLPLDNNESI